MIWAVYYILIYSTILRLLDGHSGRNYFGSNVVLLGIFAALAMFAVSSPIGRGAGDMEAELSEIQKRMNRLTGLLKTYPDVPELGATRKKRILITGGAGFVGSHLTDFLMMQGHEVTVLDNFFTGRRQNIERWIGHHNFEMVMLFLYVYQTTFPPILLTLKCFLKAPFAFRLLCTPPR